MYRTDFKNNTLQAEKEQNNWRLKKREMYRTDTRTIDYKQKESTTKKKKRKEKRTVQNWYKDCRLQTNKQAKIHD